MSQIRVDKKNSKTFDFIEYMTKVGHRVDGFSYYRAGQTENNANACVVVRCFCTAGFDFDLSYVEDGKEKNEKIEEAQKFSITLWPRYNASVEDVNAMFTSEEKVVNGQKKTVWTPKYSVKDLDIRFNMYIDKETGDATIGQRYTMLSIDDNQEYRPKGMWRGFKGANVQFDEDGNIIEGNDAAKTDDAPAAE